MLSYDASEGYKKRKAAACVAASKACPSQGESSTQFSSRGETADNSPVKGIVAQRVVVLTARCAAAFGGL
jgi:hypothetical protein